jgi:hypothetical protein
VSKLARNASLIFFIIIFINDIFDINRNLRPLLPLV